jgi:hypothetical protein
MLPAIADGYGLTHLRWDLRATSKVTFSPVSATPKPPPAPTASDASEGSTVTPRRVADIEGQRKGRQNSATSRRLAPQLRFFH